MQADARRPAASAGSNGESIFGFAFNDAARYDNDEFGPVLTTDDRGSAAQLLISGRGISAYTPNGPRGTPTVTFVEVPGVPEPATWAMLVTGFDLVGAGLRRRARPAFA